jgi:small subunit ribosomal protein S16
MSVKIRLRRMGAKAQPSYRVVVTDSRNARDGRFIETIGYYNPRRSPADIRFDERKALEWLRKGAVPSDTARSLLKKGGIWTRYTEGGTVAPERRQALAARKQRVTARRAQRRAEPSAAPGAQRARPATVATRTGRTKKVQKKEGMPPVSEGGAKA